MSYWKPVVILVAVLLSLVIAALTLNTKLPISTPSVTKSFASRNTPPGFVNLGEFLINLNSDERSKYLKATIALKLEKSGHQDSVEANIPEIRHHVNMAIQSMTASELSTYEGKSRLAEEIRRRAENVMALRDNSPIQSIASPANKNSAISGVMFTSFIIQY